MTSYLESYPSQNLNNLLATEEGRYPEELADISLSHFSSPSEIYNFLTPFFQKRAVISDLKSSNAIFFLKVAGIVGAVLARLPLIPLSLDLNSRLKGSGTVSAVFNIIAFSSFLAWSSIHLIDRLVYTLKTLEPEKSKSCQKCKVITVTAISILSGTASQLPYLFLAYKYNPSNKGMLSVTVFDIIPPIYSTSLLINQFLKKSTNSHTLQKIEKIKKYILFRLNVRLQEIINGKMPMNRYETLLESNPTYQDSVNDFFRDLTNELLDQPSLNPCIDWTKLKTAQFFGSILITIQLFWTGYLSFQGANQITSNQVGLGIIFVYVAICNLALTRLVMISSLYKMINSLTFFCNQDRGYDYISQRLWPNLSIFLSLFISIIALGSFAPAFTISSDFLNPEYVVYSTIGYGLSLAVMNVLTLNSLADTSMCYILKKLGSEEQQKEITRYEHYKSTKTIIENSSVDSLARFFFKMSDDPVFMQIMSKFNLEVDELATARK